MNKLIIFLFLFTLLLRENIYATTKVYTTQKVVGDAPKIDGSFDDEAWQNGKWEGGFYQNYPDNGAQPSQPTVFKILYDDDNIYAAIKAIDNIPSKIENRMIRRDGMAGDRLAFELDSFFDKRTGFMFGVNAAGVKSDGIIIREDGFPDLSSDPIWFVKTQITNEGWNAEMKIPLSQLRFENNDQLVWGLQIVRYYFRNQEYDTWQNVPDSLSGWVRNYGELHGISNIPAKKPIEIAPYALSKISTYKKQKGNPFADGRDFSYDLGIDGKIGISNNFTLDFAINPDFGQVEADPSQLNLTAFETFYEEKRPLFLEGNNITDYSLGLNTATQDNLFYSRRIGRSPQAYPSLAGNEKADIPERARILGAVKVTGKTKNGLSLGIIESFTNNEKAEIDTEGKQRKESVEPFTNYFLARAQKDYNNGNSILGGIFTNVYRNIKSDNLKFLNTTATTAGFDFLQYFKNKKYFFQANIAGSKITGNKEALLLQQTSSTRYFQRQDADYISVDSSRTSLSGFSGSVMFAKQINSGLTYGSFLTWRSPGFESNDMGFLNQADLVEGKSWFGYDIAKPFSVFRRVSFRADYGYTFDFGGANTIQYLGLQNTFLFNNFWSAFLHVAAVYNETSNTLLRGGPATKLPAFWEMVFRVTSDETKKFSGYASVWYLNRNEEGETNLELSSRLTYRPINSLRISTYAKYGNYENDLQYVNTKFWGKEPRYILGNLDRETLYFTLRVDYNISPDFTIQYYGSPYVSGGLFSGYKKIINSNSNNYQDRFHIFDTNEISYIEDDGIYSINESATSLSAYNFSNPDFNFKQFRSNLVLRWEFKAGSAVYLVWSQSRTSQSSNGNFDYKNDFKNLFKVSPHNVVMLKFSYRFLN